MTATDPQLAFYSAFIKAQGEFEPAIRNKANPAFKSKYADLEAVYDACRAALQANRIGIVQKPGLFVDGCLLMTTKLFHEDGGGEEQTMSVPIPNNKQDAQGIGSAITYMRRYSLLAFLGIPQEDDDGNAASGGQRDAAQKRDAYTEYLAAITEAALKASDAAVIVGELTKDNAIDKIATYILTTPGMTVAKLVGMIIDKKQQEAA